MAPLIKENWNQLLADLEIIQSVMEGVQEQGAAELVSAQT